MGERERERGRREGGREGGYTSHSSIILSMCM